MVPQQIIKRLGLNVEPRLVVRRGKILVVLNFERTEPKFLEQVEDDRGAELRVVVGCCVELLSLFEQKPVLFRAFQLAPKISSLGQLFNEMLKLWVRRVGRATSVVSFARLLGQHLEAASQFHSQLGRFVAGICFRWQHPAGSFVGEESAKERTC